MRDRASWHQGGLSVKTTLFIRNRDKGYSQSEQCHGGTGPFNLMDVLAAAEEKLFIKFIHDDVIPPG